MPRSENSSGVYCPKHQNFRTSRLSRSAHVPNPGQVRNGYGRVRGVGATPPRTCFIRSSPADVKQNKRSRACDRKNQNSSNYRLEMMPTFVNNPAAADTKIQPKSISGIATRHAFFLQLLACNARHPSAFTSVCGTDTAGGGTFQPPPEAGAQTKLFDREFQFRESHT